MTAVPSHPTQSHSAAPPSTSHRPLPPPPQSLSLARPGGSAAIPPCRPQGTSALTSGCKLSSPNTTSPSFSSGLSSLSISVTPLAKSAGASGAPLKAASSYVGPPKKNVISMRPLLGPVPPPRTTGVVEPAGGPVASSGHPSLLPALEFAHLHSRSHIRVESVSSPSVPEVNQSAKDSGAEETRVMAESTTTTTTPSNTEGEPHAAEQSPAAQPVTATPPGAVCPKAASTPSVFKTSDPQPLLACRKVGTVSGSRAEKTSRLTSASAATGAQGIQAKTSASTTATNGSSAHRKTSGGLASTSRGGAALTARGRLTPNSAAVQQQAALREQRRREIYAWNEQLREEMNRDNASADAV